MEECVRMMQQNLRSAPSIKKRAKSVYSQRNLGTIKERKKEKSREQETSSEQTIMRILRMRFVFFLSLQVPKDMMLIHLFQTTDARFHCSTAANHDSDASRTRATSTGGGGAQGETTTTGPPSRYHPTCSSITCSLTCFRSFSYATF